MSDYTYIEDGELGDFPSLEQLNRYLKGEMSEEERKELESKMVDDPLFADVIEGLGHVSSPKSMQQSIYRLKSESKRRIVRHEDSRSLNSKRKSRVKPNTFTQLSLSIAAGISLLLVSVWLVKEMVQLRPESATEAFITQAEPPANDAIASGEQLEEKIEGEELSNVAKPEGMVIATDSIKLQLDSGTYSSGFFANARSNTNFQTTSPSEETDLHFSQKEYESINDDIVPTDRQESVLKEELAEAETPIRSEAEPALVETDDEEMSLDGNANAPTVSSVPAPASPPVEETPKRTFTKEEVEKIQEYKQLEEESVLNSVPPREQKRKKAISRRGRRADEEAQFDKDEFVAPSMSEEQQQWAKVNKASAIADLIAEAANLYQKGSYEASNMKLSEVFLSSPGNETAMYMMGENYLALNEQKKAVNWFEKILDNPESLLFEKTQWKLVQTYLSMGKERSAKKLLEQLTAKDSPYSDQATQTLDSLKNQ